MVLSQPLCPLCPLCGAKTDRFYADKKREYYLCDQCLLVHVPSQFHLTDCLEKAEYDKHENSFEDDGYRKFLSRMLLPITQIVDVESAGLDFGCGPQPVLADMFTRQGYSMSVYDKYYFPDQEVLRNTYDFIVATEVVEHLAQPQQVLNRIRSCINSGGILGVMTKRWLDRDKFIHWHYKNDPTHISFYHEKTFEFIADVWGVNLQIVGADVILLSDF